MAAKPEASVDPETGDARDGASFGAVLTARALLHPDAPAFTTDGETSDFRSLERRSNRYAHYFRAQGLGSGDRLALFLSNSVEFVAATFACWKIGAVPCPIPLKLSVAERREVLHLLEPKAVIAETLGFDAGHICLTPGDRALQTCSAAPLPDVTSANMKILCSGGSTGRPKLIVDPLPAVWGPDKRGYRREEATVLSIPGPLYHTSPFMNALCGIAQGTHVISTSRFDPVEWLDAVERYKVAHAWLVPTMMGRIAKLPEGDIAGRDLSSLQMLVHVAAPCPQSVKRWWIERIGAEKVWELYGGTERIGATFISGTEWLERPGSVGRPNPGDKIVITDDDGKALPPGAIGEIHFQRENGPGAYYRYLGADTRIQGKLDSFGDMGWLDDDGYLFIADRRTDMFKVNGTKVYPAEIENVACNLPQVLGCAVIGLPDEDMGNRIHCIVELVPDFRGNIDEAWLLAELRELLAPGKRPHSVELTDAPLRDDAGKIRRSQLREVKILEDAGGREGRVHVY